MKKDRTTARLLAMKASNRETAPNSGTLNLSTLEIEKQQLFNALAKAGKRWNADTKQIEDLPKPCEFKPFDKVLVRDNDDNKWQPAFFIALSGVYKDEYPYEVISKDDTSWKQCIPYEGNEHLLGTNETPNDKEQEP